MLRLSLAWLWDSVKASNGGHRVYATRSRIERTADGVILDRKGRPVIRPNGHPVQACTWSCLDRARLPDLHPGRAPAARTPPGGGPRAGAGRGSAAARRAYPNDNYKMLNGGQKCASLRRLRSEIQDSSSSVP